MKKSLILRRRRLGLTSCREVCKASQTGLKFVRNDQMTDNDFEGVDMVIRWGCTSTVPINSVLNTAEAIHRVSDKAGFRKLLCGDPDTKENTPTTIFSLYEYTSPEWETSYLVRPQHHSQGRHAYLVHNYPDLSNAAQKCGSGWYASRFIQKAAEYRVFVVQGRVVWIANKIPANPDAVCWNVAQGGKFENVSWGNWPENVIRVAVNSFKKSGLDFAGVDIMVDTDGKAWNIEINSAPSMTSPYRQSCTAKVFDYINIHGKAHMEFDADYEGWRHFIHPAIWSKT